MSIKQRVPLPFHALKWCCASSRINRALTTALVCFAAAGCITGEPGPASAEPKVIEPVGTELLQPSWFTDATPTQDARLALAALANAESEGLDPDDYRAQELAFAFERVEQGAVAPELKERLDTELTVALERYLSDMNNGRLSPEVLSHRFKAPPVYRFDAQAYLVQARQSGRFAEALQSARPDVPMYRALRSMMNAYRGMAQHPAWHTRLPPLTQGALKPGQVYEGLPLVVARLVALGDLPERIDTPSIYDDMLVQGIKRFQARHGLEPDGVIGVATLRELEVTPSDRVKQMALTLERLRWTPTLYARRMIAINVPEFVLRAYELEGREIELHLEMRVIVGRALDTETPIFLEQMEFIEFSPYWNVPPSIARGETLPRIRRDPGYFSRQGFEFVRRDGGVVRALTNEGIEAVQRGQWRIRQRPGPTNALGDIKFIFPNDQNIYLHHTPAPELFTRARRDFSHGCIRIEYPVELAQFVLRDQPEWTSDRIQQAMQAGKSRTLKLDASIPVLIAYSTAVVKRDGKVYFFPDIYQQDLRLEQALLKARLT